MSGVVILLSKKTWALLGGFADGFLGVDNAIHQAARDRGFPVYLMEGVYVYHWYRAGANLSTHGVNGHAAETSNGRCEGTHEDGGIAAATWGRVPITGRRILLIGHDVAAAGEHLRGGNPASLAVVELNESVVERARQCLGEIHVADDEGNGVEFADGSFDAIIACDLLEHLRRPARILERLGRWLACSGRLITSFHTVRSLSVVEELLAGHWLGGTSPVGARQPRFDITRAARPRSFCTDRVSPPISWKRSLEEDIPNGLPAAAQAGSKWAGSISMVCRQRMLRSFTHVGFSLRLSLAGPQTLA